MLFLWFLLNKEDIVVAFADEWVFDLFALEAHEDFVFLLFFHLMGQWLLFLLLLFGLLATLLLIINGPTSCFSSKQVIFQRNYHILFDIIGHLVAGSFIHVLLFLLFFSFQLELPQFLIYHLQLFLQLLLAAHASQDFLKTAHH